MKKTVPWIGLLLLIATQGAQADRSPTADRVAANMANTCASSLQPYARLVFDAVVAQPRPELTLRTLIEARVRELVFMDRLMISAARPAAEAASQCLRISRNCTGDRC
jgi:hypothetical protein